MQGNTGIHRGLWKGRWTVVWLLSACAVLSGCASNHDGVREISAELQRRTGHGLAETKSAVPAVSGAERLTEDELVALALSNNAAFQETLADLDLSRADLVQAGMVPNPTLWMLFPVGIKPVELLLRYPIEVFWLRSKRIESAELEVQRVAQQLVQNGLDVIRDVRLASAELALAEERVELAKNSARLADDIAELTGLLFRDGDGTELEVSNARVDALQAEEQLGRWRSDAGIARERLRTLVGLGLQHWPEMIEPRPLALSVPPAPDSLVEEALATRPDLRAAEIRMESSGERIGLARAEVFMFTAILSTKPINIDGPALSGPGLDITLPIFNQNQGGVAQARARLEKDARFYNTLRDRIVLEVREASAKLTQARKSHELWQNEILPPLADAVQYAEKAYTAGNVSYLFVLEAQRKWLDARQKVASVATDLRRARAELERSVGRSLDHSTQWSKVSSS